MEKSVEAPDSLVGLCMQGDWNYVPSGPALFLYSHQIEVEEQL